MPKPATPTLLAWDTEDTGLDFEHGCRPYLITLCDGTGDNVFYEWDVNPLTRMPEIPEGDIEEIEQALTEPDYTVAQNGKFDIKALKSVGITVPAHRMRDTLIASHLLFSGEAHDLASLCIKVLGIDIQPKEDVLHQAVNRARAYVRKTEYMSDWQIAVKGHPMMPSIKGSTSQASQAKGTENASFWKVDAWLPRAIALHEGWDENHENGHWLTVCSEYANSDSFVLLPLYKALIAEIKFRGLWELYLERMKLVPITLQMETNGLTYSNKRLKKVQKEFRTKSHKHAGVCARLSGGKLEQDNFPKGTSKALKETFFDVLELPITKRTKSGQPSTDKDTVEQWLDTFPQKSPAHRFLSSLQTKKKLDTALGFIDDYDLRGVCAYCGEPNIVSTGGWLSEKEQCDKHHNTFRVLHPWLNITGAATLRFSSSNPNSQQCSKQEGVNLRQMFGPVPGREWFSLDYNNIELRIPAYESGEEEMVALFEKPDEGPYYGSYHLLVAHTLHPELFEECLSNGEAFNKKYKTTWYQWTKNGNFSLAYGAGQQKADQTYHKKGAFKTIKSKFKKLAKLNDHYINLAQTEGFVPTMVDKRFGIGYPIQTLKNQWGKVKPTIPFNYHVQSTAMWAMSSAMIRVQEYLDKLNKSAGMDVLHQQSYRIICQLHDELIFDFPQKPPKKLKKTNFQIADDIRKLMEKSGDDIGVPLTVGIDWHPHNWGETKEYQTSA